MKKLMTEYFELRKTIGEYFKTTIPADCQIKDFTHRKWLIRDGRLYLELDGVFHGATPDDEEVELFESGNYCAICESGGWDSHSVFYVLLSANKC